MTRSLPSLRTLARVAALVALATAGGGCASRKSEKQPVLAMSGGVPSADPAPAERMASLMLESRVGTVHLIGRGGKFVLFETTSGGLLTLPDGQDLHCRSGAGPGASRTADLRLSRERRQQFASADVVSGQPQVGDAVFIGGPVKTPSSLPAETGGMLPPPSAPGGRR